MSLFAMYKIKGQHVNCSNLDLHTEKTAMDPGVGCAPLYRRAMVTLAARTTRSWVIVTSFTRLPETWGRHDFETGMMETRAVSLLLAF